MVSELLIHLVKIESDVEESDVLKPLNSKSSQVDLSYLDKKLKCSTENTGASKEPLLMQ